MCQAEDSDCDLVVVLPETSYQVVTEAPLTTIESRFAFRDIDIQVY